MDATTFDTGRPPSKNEARRRAEGPSNLTVRIPDRMAVDSPPYKKKLECMNVAMPTALLFLVVTETNASILHQEAGSNRKLMSINGWDAIVGHGVRCESF